LLWLLLAIGTLAFGARAGQDALDGDGLDESLGQLKILSLEELMEVEITSVSKRPEKRTEAAAAIYVITHQDIRRSGARSLPDLLRTVPGVNVANLDASKRAVSIRGLNDRFANKLLVLVDGRSVYTPLFAGVFWEDQNILLEDVERIEVIRGPGGTLWGSNAVNGVINIITRHARDTHGVLATAGIGTEERAFGALRYGGALEGRGHYRVYGQFSQRDERALPDGSDATDNWNSGRLGLRFDLQCSERDELTVIGEAAFGDHGQTLVMTSLLPPYARHEDDRGDLARGHLHVLWGRRLSDTSDFSLAASYEMQQRHDANSGDDRNTFDLEFQHRLAVGKRHQIVWGGGFRSSEHTAHNTFQTFFGDGYRHDILVNAFVQDEIALIDDALRLTLGSKFEYNDYTGIEVQPSIRIAWLPDDKQTLWAAVSRAVRVPSRAESDVRLNSQAFPFGLVSLFGNEDIEAEDLLAYELGYRIAPHHRLMLDVAAFYNEYDDLRTIEFEMPFLELFPLPPHLTIPARGQNNMKATTWGIEAAVEWSPVPRVRLRGSYAYLNVDLDIEPKTFDVISAMNEGSSPEQQASLALLMDLTDTVQADLTARYVDTLPTLDIDDYFELDARLAWRPSEHLTLEVVGQNLLHDQHPEFAPGLLPLVASETERGVYAKVVWEF